MRRRRLRYSLLAGLAATAALSPAPARAQVRVSEFYVTAATTMDWSPSTSFRDRDCTSESPPALYGCGPGQDALPLGAYGDFGPSMGFELGLGTRVSDIRVEARFLYHPNLAFEGTSNFLGVPDEQPVRGKLTSGTVFLAGYIDLGDLRRSRSRVVPFLGAGAGVTRHRIEEVRFDFPGIGPDARTVLAGGTQHVFSWMTGGGLLVRVADWAMMELGYRYSKLGEAATEDGDMRVVRPDRDEMIFVGGTRARLETHGLSAGFRLNL